MSFDFSKLSVLLAEDTYPMRQLMFAVLETLGVGKIYSTENGEEALNVFCRYNPDIVIADWEMAPMNGLELTQEIRSSVMSPNRMAPVILVTGYTVAARVDMARDAGVTEFLVKPFTARDMANRLAYVINRPRDFVTAPGFFGPDRRRRKNPHYKGPQRRTEDQSIGRQA